MSDRRDAIGFSAPPPVLACVKAVARLGRPVFAVGGSVRDAALGLPIEDWDFATAARPDEVAAQLSEFGPIDALPDLGCVRVVAGGQELVVTTFREEGDYGDDRRPGWLRFVDEPARDALRRDFSVNAIYVDALGGEVIDPTGGRDDLLARRLRLIGDPEQRLREDPLRALRALRFEVSRALTPTAATVGALSSTAPLVARLRPERRLDELRRTFRAPAAALAVQRLVDCGLLGPAIAALRGEDERVRRRALPVFVALRAEAMPMTERELLHWAALLGEPQRAAAVFDELRAPRGLLRAVVRVLELAAQISRAAPGAARRRILAATPAAVVAFASAQLRQQGDLDRADELAAAGREAAAHSLAPLPDGRDVLALGLPPGPLVGSVLRATHARIEREAVEDRDRMLAILGEELRRAVKSDPGRDR